MQLTNSWKAFFDNLSSNDETDKNLNILANATLVDDSTSSGEILRTLTEDNESIIMIVTPITKKIKFIHNASNLGGTRRRPNNKIVALDGFEDMAMPIIIGTDSITTTIQIRTPTFTTLSALQSTEDLIKSIPANNGRFFKHTTFVFLPPFLFRRWINMDSREPETLFFDCITAINEFDNSHKDDESYKDAAKDHCKHILLFLWAASKELLPATQMVPANDDTEIATWSKRTHQNYISLPASPIETNTSNTSEIIQSLALSIENQTSFFEILQHDKQSEKEEKLNKYVDLHDSSKLLILNASSEDGQNAPTIPVDTCVKFFKQKTVAKAIDFLQNSLTNDFNCCVSIESGLVTALYSGHFLRNREDSPSNFSFFLTPKKQPLSAGHFQPTMILQLKTTQGKGWSEMDMKETLKQGIVTPDSINSFTHQLRNLWALSAFFFGPNSILSQRLTLMMSILAKYTLTFEGAQIRDNSFATKLGYAIDTRVFRWLDQCSANDDRHSVNDNLLSFNTLVDQVLTDSFIQHLPVTIKQISLPQKEKNINDQHSQNLTPQKRQKLNEKEKIINKDPIKDC